MANKTLYLFECTSTHCYAVSDDQTGAAIPKFDPAAGWLLRREIAPDDLPADVVLTTHTKGFCLLEGDEISGPDR